MSVRQFIARLFFLYLPDLGNVRTR